MVKIFIILAPLIFLSAFVIKTYSFDKKPVLPDSMCKSLFNSSGNQCLPGCIYSPGSSDSMNYDYDAAAGGPIPQIVVQSKSCDGW